MSKLPAELPEKPDGWTRKMVMHMNFGKSGGSGEFEVFDADGNKMPIRYAYSTVGNGESGFCLGGGGRLMSWDELREAWPAFYFKTGGGKRA